MNKVLLALAAIAGALMLVPGMASAGSVSGTVVASDDGSSLVAKASGRVVTYGRELAVGTEIKNGSVSGDVSTAQIHGTVVASRGATAYVDANGYLVAIHAAAGLDDGEIMTTAVKITASGTLKALGTETQTGVDADGTAEITAEVLKIGIGTVTLAVDNSAAVTFDLAGDVTLARSLLHTTVTVDVEIS